METLINSLKNNRFVYFFYFAKKTDWRRLLPETGFAAAKTGKSRLVLLQDMVLTSLKWGFSFHEYFFYGFFEKNAEERKRYASMADMYEFQLFNNPKPTRFYLENKLVFLKEYAPYVGRKWLNLRTASPEDVRRLISGRDRMVLKNAHGGAGKSVRIISVSDGNAPSLLAYAREMSCDLLEEYVIQHQELTKLSPRSLNTIRVITQINIDGGVDILGTRLRMGIDLVTDNLSTGGIGCSIDLETGVIDGPGISFDVTQPDFSEHPVSKMKFVGFQIPFWQRILNMCREAALLHPENKSIGWDVAVKDSGPILIEGNHDWGARLWQMPVKQGLRHVLGKYVPKPF